MSFKYVVLNLLLCSVILLLGIKNYNTWNRPAELPPAANTVQEKPKIINGNLPGVAPNKESLPADSHNSISENNIFSPERKDFPIPAPPPAAAVAQKPIVRPQIVLYGVTIAGDYESATVINPGRSLRKDERETLIIKVGQNIGEYKLARILPDRIAMEANGDSFEVLLYDSRNPKKRMEIRTEAKPTMIASAQPAPVPSGTVQMDTPSQEPAAKSEEPVQGQIFPFNKHTYQLLGPSAIVARGKIFIPPSSPSAEEPGSN